MRSLRTGLAMAISLGLMFVAGAGVAAAAPADHFGCRASVARVTGLGVLDAEPTVANSADDPCNNDSAQVLGLNLPGVLNTAAATAATTSAATGAASSADLANLSVALLGLGLSADAMHSNAGYACVQGTPVPTGSSQVVNLRLGLGAPLTTSAPISLSLPGIANVDLNRTTVSGDTIVQRAADITILGAVDHGAEIVLGESTARTDGNPCDTGAGGSNAPEGNPGSGGNPPSGGSPPSGGTPPSGGNPSGSGTLTSTSPPTISGTPRAGRTLTCTTGAWSYLPARFAYQWNRNGTPLSGATGAGHRIATLDEGSRLTCTVTAYSSGGDAISATSRGVLVVLPVVAGCPAAAGRLAGSVLGPVALGITRTQARRAFSHSSNRGRRYQDFFCLTPIGVRVGYASSSLLISAHVSPRTLPADRVVLALTGNPMYALSGVHPGATLAYARHRLGRGNLFHVGLNDWYLVVHRSWTAVLKLRHQLVEEVGTASAPLTRTRHEQSVFIRSFL